jgi:DNA-binding response OmpR family regulator
VAGKTVLVIDDSPTILKVVQLVLTKAGFNVITASDGEEGITRAYENHPDMILLDFVMPKMNGYQVCRGLSDSPTLKTVPVVLMSAKGDQVGERFVKVMGIVDYITKPFSPEAITAVVQHTIGKYAHRGGNGEATTTPIELATETHLRPVGAITEALPLDEQRANALAQLREELLTALGDQADKAVLRLDDAMLARAIGPYARALTAADEPTYALQGELRLVPIAEVLTLLASQRQWGLLELERGDAKVRVAFKQGKVELAFADGLGDEFLLGRYLVDNQALSRHDLDLFLQSRAKSEPEQPKPMGEQLVKMSYVSEADLKQALARQSQERIYEVLRWPTGQFRFTATRELPPLAVDAALGLDVDGILMEGFRRVDEWHLIEREIDDFDDVFLRNEEAVQDVGRARLTREELAVLELVTGKNSVKEIVRQSRMSSFDVSKMLFRLLSIKLIRRRVAPVAV